MKNLTLTFVLLFLTGSIYAQNERFALKLILSGESSATLSELNDICEDLIEDYNSEDGVVYAYPNSGNPELERYFDFYGTGDVEAAISDFESVNMFETVEKYGTSMTTNSCYSPYPQVNDYWTSQGWVTQDELDLVEARCAWNLSTGDPSIVVGVADNEFNESHEDLANKIVAIDGPSNPGYGHGTTVAGAIAAETNNQKGVASLGYNTSLACERIELLPSGRALDTDIKNAIWALYQDGRPIINVSWSGTGLARAAANQIVNDGTVLVISAGNEVKPPALQNHKDISDIQGVINVSSVNNNNKHMPSGVDPEDTHSHNEHVDLCAPGYNVGTTAHNGTYHGATGTSLAAPMVSATVALMLDVNHCLSPANIEEILKSTCDPIDDADQFPGQLGAGRLNAYRAVDVASSAYSQGLDLFVKDKQEDFGNEQTPYIWTQAGGDQSPDIWVRNQQDGFSNHEHEAPIYNNGNPVYVYVKVRNKSCVTSTGEEKLSLYWSKASSFSSWPNNWDGSQPTVGDEINSLDIPSLDLGEEVILEFEWNILDPGVHDNWNSCLLARIENSSVDNITTYSNRLDNDVLYNNNIAMRNVSIIQLQIGGESPGFDSELEQSIDGFYPHGGNIYVGNVGSSQDDFDLHFTADSDDNGTNILDEAEVKLIFDQALWNKVKNQVLNDEAFEVINDQEVLVRNENAVLSNITIPDNERYPLYVGVHYLTDEVTTNENGLFHVQQKYSGDSLYLGGVHYQTRKDTNRYLFQANVGSGYEEVNLGDSLTLHVNELEEEAYYIWYDDNSVEVGRGTSVTVSPASSTTYKVDVIASKDSYKDTEEVFVQVKEAWINSISPNPATTSITVDYQLMVGSAAKINISNSTGTVVQQETITSSATQKSINVSNLTTGSYTVSINYNGQVLDSETLIIQ
jgi:hypothetical protein